MLSIRLSVTDICIVWLFAGALLTISGLWVWWNIKTAPVEDEPWPTWLPKEDEEED